MLDVTPITTATKAAASHSPSQYGPGSSPRLVTAAPRATMPVAICPHPETPVNAEALSMVSLM
jgi:hypothetical protein